MDKRAFTYEINPFGTTKDENNSVNQSSPAWVLTFVSWNLRDSLRNKAGDASEVRNPIVVESDCISVTTSQNKGTLTPSMSATLVMADVNYETAIAPGDFVVVNMLNWEKDAERIANNARKGLSINGPNDGFKGLFKVQGVRKILFVEPGTGAKYVLFKINGFAFTEFNNTIYYNQYLIDPNMDRTNQILFASRIGEFWKSMINGKGFTKVQDIIALLVQCFIGSGASKEGRYEKGDLVKTPNTHFFMPALIGNLLGISNVTAAKDIYNFIFGIQNYNPGSQTTRTLADGMNPNMKVSSTHKGRFYFTDAKCRGDSFLKPEYWNQVQTWSILNQYTNAPLNELYTCFKISKDNTVLPTVVFRQIPFTNEDYSGNAKVTRFLTLPRWKIDPSLILELDIGRDEAARVNFVQYFGRSTIDKNGGAAFAETAKINFLYDIKDVQRSGLRPYIVTTQFDEPGPDKDFFESPKWAKIVGDCLIGGHLKMNGTIKSIGITEPMTVGDNLELDNVVYHIEQITDTCNVSMEGKKTFRTTLSLSNGIDLSSSAAGTRYAEMTNVDANDLRNADHSSERLLPGVSESKATPTGIIPKNPFPQPKGKK